jgi:hypothetical protein
LPPVWPACVSSWLCAPLSARRGACGFVACERRVFWRARRPRHRDEHGRTWVALAAADGQACCTARAARVLVVLVACGAETARCTRRASLGRSVLWV